jgi:hypothetical protein
MLWISTFGLCCCILQFINAVSKQLLSCCISSLATCAMLGAPAVVANSRKTQAKVDLVSGDLPPTTTKAAGECEEL